MRARTNADDWEGILLVHKPIGMTSHDVVVHLRRHLGLKKIGHAGTLDPMASGLLIMLIGKATKASHYFSSKDKIYQGIFQLGITTDTQDSDGQVVDMKPVPDLSEGDLKEYMAHFVGDQYQLPPMYSAKKIHGKPLYKMARKGLEVERERRFVHVYSFDLIAYRPPMVEFRLVCSKGTYVRTMAHDVGRQLGCGAHLTQLCRTRSGEFDLEQALTLEVLETMPLTSVYQSLIPLHKAVPLSL